MKNNSLIPVDFTAAEVEQELEELLKDPVVPPKQKSDAQSIGTIDAVPADNGSTKTQEDWITNYWPSVRDGRIMASMGDYYLLFKQMKHDSEHGNTQQKASVQTLLANYQKDFTDTWLIAGTRISYNTTSLDAKIIQHYGCNQPKLITESNLTIPIYRGAIIADVTKESAGLKYLQALLNTTDTAENIIGTLEFISGKPRNQIKVWSAATSGDYTRSSHPERAAGFLYLNSEFHFYGGYIINQGRSRGVRR